MYNISIILRLIIIPFIIQFSLRYPFHLLYILIILFIMLDMPNSIVPILLIKSHIIIFPWYEKFIHINNFLLIYFLFFDKFLNFLFPRIIIIR